MSLRQDDDADRKGEKVTENDLYLELIATRLAEAEAQRVALTQAIDDIRADRSLNFTDDEHDPEGSTVSLDQAREAALLAQTERTVAELKSAQVRLADGTYGICESCNKAIPTQRMLARPEARRCVPCSSVRRRP